MKDIIEQMLEDPNRSPAAKIILSDLLGRMDEGFSFEEAKILTIRLANPFRKPLAILLIGELSSKVQH